MTPDTFADEWEPEPGCAPFRRELAALLEEARRGGAGEMRERAAETALSVARERSDRYASEWTAQGSSALYGAKETAKSIAAKLSSLPLDPPDAP